MYLVGTHGRVGDEGLAILLTTVPYYLRRPLAVRLHCYTSGAASCQCPSAFRRRAPHCTILLQLLARPLTIILTTLLY